MSPSGLLALSHRTLNDHRGRDGGCFYSSLSKISSSKTLTAVSQCVCLSFGRFLLLLVNKIKLQIPSLISKFCFTVIFTSTSIGQQVEHCQSLFNLSKCSYLYLQANPVFLCSGFYLFTSYITFILPQYVLYFSLSIKYTYKVYSIFQLFRQTGVSRRTRMQVHVLNAL